MDYTTRPQSTIKQPAAVSGFGFWSGNDITLEFVPADENSGVVFVRTDLPGQPRISATIQNRISGPRRTSLVHNGCAVEMVEHVLAALAGLQIDNCEIRVNRAEMPGVDGSSLPFVEALLLAEKQLQDSTQPVCQVTESIRVGDDECWVEAHPVTDGQTRLTYHLDYADCDAIEAQSFSSILNPENFQQQFAPARTFLLESEAERLQHQGLGDRVSYKDVLVFNEAGPINNTLRFTDECARHKALDMVGDFSLLGKDLVGEFIASKSGHRLNSQMVFALLQNMVVHPSLTRKSA